jgi:putative Mg2+ transporter-C (MgtC) family protein
LTICYLLVLIYSLLIHVGPLLLYFRAKRDWCLLEAGEGERMLAKNSRDHAGGFADADNPYENPDYDTDPCRYIRLPELCFLTLEECDISRRLLMSVILGGAIGYERRIADRPAGIRTMGLVSLGACFFTVSSIMGFKTSTMGWDASRVTAALPSGVGFLGGALIWKGTVFVDDQEMHQVHGLTTAASLWLSAAIGVGVGGGLYLVTIYAVSCGIMNCVSLCANRRR